MMFDNVKCPDCGDFFSRGRGLGIHRAKMHGQILRAARAAVAPELNRPIIEAVADRIIEELKGQA
jgi:hypothetical protein